MDSARKETTLFCRVRYWKKCYLLPYYPSEGVVWGWIRGEYPPTGSPGVAQGWIRGENHPKIPVSRGKIPRIRGKNSPKSPFLAWIRGENGPFWPILRPRAGGVWWGYKIPPPLLPLYIKFLSFLTGRARAKTRLFSHPFSKSPFPPIIRPVSVPFGLISFCPYAPTIPPPIGSLPTTDMHRFIGKNVPFLGRIGYPIWSDLASFLHCNRCVSALQSHAPTGPFFRPKIFRKKNLVAVLVHIKHMY